MITIDNEVLFVAVEQRLAEGQQVQLPLRGTSMEPLLKDGDVLTLTPDAGGLLSVGDVVLFCYHGRHLLHRIVAIDGDNVTTQGDNCRCTEACIRADVVARLVSVSRDKGGRELIVDSPEWRRLSQRSLMRKSVKNTLLRWFDREGRRRIRPWYFSMLAFLMWAPLNGVGIPLDNYILGLRADHLLHASVYLPCFFLIFNRRSRLSPLAAWLIACCIGITTEWVQYLLPYRGFDINDLVANFIGVSLGSLITVLAYRRIG